MQHHNNFSQPEWTLEIVPSHADRVTIFKDIVREIFVTMIPGSSTLDSIEALEIVKNAGFTPVPHIAARNFESEAELKSFLAKTKELGIRKVLLLAGGQARAEGPFSEALDIIKHPSFATSGIQTACIAGHPEGNPEDPNCWKNLEKKVQRLREMGIDTEIVTQWSFSPESVSNFLAALKTRGIEAPVRVGVAGPASLKTLIKYAKVCGVNAATTVMRKQGFNMARLLVSNNPNKFVSKVHGSHLFHLYPFGGLQKCATWLENEVAGVNA
ncbi:methylenetetrahydrofolate reductase [Pelagicoccus enzymogenes]|uniref:methylenetetrahydrofolate reductase n=1 Tax=Pelagicoccus enzymogenes TaxID=2773457 RepID=UPI00280C8BF6|nr:methylenetetrahydrofolate reductase [Pelagicoccus enzymogenes]MDQ8200826.1 methylenetetrahydrofolate reductase [Pelagicoccus enzymogenes]